jgi:hypothetical protein
MSKKEQTDNHGTNGSTDTSSEDVINNLDRPLTIRQLILRLTRSPEYLYEELLELDYGSDLSKETVNEIFRINPNIVATSLLKLKNICKSLHPDEPFPYLTAAGALLEVDIENIRDLRKLQELMRLLEENEGVDEIGYYEIAANYLKKYPALDPNSVIMLLTFNRGKSDIPSCDKLKVNDEKILSIDQKVNVSQLIEVVEKWQRSFKKMLDETALTETKKEQQRALFSQSAMEDVTAALKGNKHIEIDKMFQLMEAGVDITLAAKLTNDYHNVDWNKAQTMTNMFEAHKINLSSAAKILDKHPEVNLDKMLPVLNSGASPSLSVQLINDYPTVDWNKAQTMVNTFKEYNLDIAATAKLLEKYPHVDLEKMHEVVVKFEADYLEIRDNLPIELFKETVDISEQFYHNLFDNVLEVMECKENKDMSTSELLRILQNQQTEIKSSDAQKPVQSWTQSEKNETLESKNIDDNIKDFTEENTKSKKSS